MRHRRGYVTAVAAGLIALAVLAGDNDARAGLVPPSVTWSSGLSPAVNISNSDGPSSVPVTAADTSGNIVAAWVDGTTGTNQIWATVSINGGATWSPAENVSGTDNPAGGPSVWVNDEGAGVSFYETFVGDTAIRYYSMQRFDDGLGWRAPEPFGQAYEPDFSERAAWASSNPGVASVSVAGVYTTPTVGGYDVRAVLSKDGGVTFDPPVLLNPGEPILNRIDLTVGAKPGDPATQQFLAVGTFANGDVNTWTLDVTPQAGWDDGAGVIDSFGSRDAKLATDDSGTPRLYWETRVSPIRILTATLTPTGWGDFVQVSGDRSASGVDFATLSGFATFTWVEINPTTGESQIMAAFSDDGGMTFGEPFAVSDPDVSAEKPQVVADETKATVLYRETAGSTSEPKVAVIDFYHFDTGGKPVVVNFLLLLADVDIDLTTQVLAWADLVGTKPQGSPSQPLTAPYPLLFGTAVPDGESSPDIFVATAGQAGDNNCDGETDELDALGIAGALAGFTPGACVGLTDINCDDLVGDVADLLLVLRGTGGLPVEVPPDCLTIER